MREGTVPSYEDSGARVDRRRSLLGRFRARREAAAAEAAPLDDEADAPPPARRGRRRPAGAGPRAPAVARVAPSREPAAPRAAGAAAGARAAPRARGARPASSTRSPRRSTLFNGSEHPRTVAGIARSLGRARRLGAAGGRAPVAWSTWSIAWELCWYRYEVDLSDEVPTVRVSAQGYELDELDARGAPAQRGRRRARHARRSADWPVARRSTRQTFDGRSMADGPIASARVIYCVVPEALADELLDKLTDYYADDPNVTVIVDRRRSSRREGGSLGWGQARGPRPPSPADPRRAARAGHRLSPAASAPPAKLVLHVDGGARGNPGPAAIGVVDLAARRRGGRRAGRADRGRHQQRRRVPGGAARARAGGGAGGPRGRDRSATPSWWRAS